MLVKTILLLVAAAAPAFAYEPVTCTRNDTQDLSKAVHITASITDADNFCTMMTGYGVNPVAPNEGCGEVYCQGKIVADSHPMPKGYILSSHYVKNTSYVQITGCIDSSVWGQDPRDDGGQMDSHGWPFKCQGYPKFVSLIEPATNTFCIRCCDKDDNVDCNTSISTKGCWNVIPGVYTMADGSACKAPNNSTVPPSSSASAGVPTATGSTPSATVSGSVGLPGTTTGTGGNTNPTNAGPRLSYSLEFVGSVAVFAMAVAASL
ncbi:hypothetical protein KVV02_005145 [Mortierella alpina]|uniref:Secreted protein n=1 Tax=Mortierella alpina TaxID=64518 RepID=A0A9P8CVQ3_MORAP|nr:hypothetical protein KVV02_005145 [Mortierella alpina]